MKKTAKPFSGWGKIPSLPFVLLLDLSGRLRNGENQTTVLAWLNTQAFVKHRMKMRFKNEPISAENLSSWYRRDHQSYLRHVDEIISGPGAITTDHLETYRKGKIARLPYQIRCEINLRILNGHSYAKISAWLNSQPIVIDRMNRYFDGLPIGASSLSAWRTGGYMEWLNQKEKCSPNANG